MYSRSATSCHGPPRPYSHILPLFLFLCFSLPVAEQIMACDQGLPEGREHPGGRRCTHSVGAISPVEPLLVIPHSPLFPLFSLSLPLLDPTWSPSPSLFSSPWNPHIQRPVDTLLTGTDVPEPTLLLSEPPCGFGTVPPHGSPVLGAASRRPIFASSTPPHPSVGVLLLWITLSLPLPHSPRSAPSFRLSAWALFLALFLWPPPCGVSHYLLRHFPKIPPLCLNSLVMLDTIILPLLTSN